MIRQHLRRSVTTSAKKDRENCWVKIVVGIEIAVALVSKQPLDGKIRPVKLWQK